MVGRSPSRCLSLPTAKNKLQLDFDESKLSLTFDKLPPSVRTLQECAAHQIQFLLDKEKQSPTSLSFEEEEALDDGFFLCDLNVVRRKLIVWHQLFPRVHPFFAVKCNPDPMIAAVIGLCGGGFDCASVPEIELALQCSTTDEGPHQPASQKIVYANPQRAEQALDRALALNIRALTFDGPEELYKVHRAYQKLLEAFRSLSPSDNSSKDCQDTRVPDPPGMILRILVPDEHSTVPLGEKFGASPDQVVSLAELAVALHLPIVGVSFHCGSGNHDPESYHQAIRLAYAALQTINDIQTSNGGEPCWLLDIGGGYPGEDGMGGDLGRFCGDQEVTTIVREQDPSNTETATKIGHVVTPLLDELFPVDSNSSVVGSAKQQQQQVTCIAEPGRYFVEAAFALCSRIYRVRVQDCAIENDKRCSQRRHYFIAQGVQGVFKDCLLCNESFVPIPLILRQDTAAALDETVVPSIVHGPSGEDYDVICQDYPLPVLQVGDWLVFDRMGAYTLSIAARSGRPPVRYVMGSSQLSVV